jgi:aldehyde:ferredoxin oxidoreductase
MEKVFKMCSFHKGGLKMMGYNNRIGRVNLKEMQVKYEGLREDIIKKFIGGKGLAYYFIYKEVPPGTKPLSASNKLIFAPGAFSGLIPASSKVAVAALSPETGLINDSYAGDRFGPMLKKAGFDLLIIENKNNKPVYIVVDKDEIKIEDASELWGKGVYETCDILWEKYPDSAIAAIGPGGENLVRFANIVFDKERAAGRGGLGAVMGSKKLKAVVVRNSQSSINIYDEEELNKLKEKYYDEYAKSKKLKELREYGTTNGLIASSFSGMAPAYNFQKPYIPKELAEKLSGDEIKKYEVEPEEYIHGKSCPVKCARYVKINFKGKEFFVKPEYESIAMLGACTGVFDFPAVAYFIHLTNDLGLDSIATGNIIGWLFEMVEKNLISSEEIGFEVRGFGDIDAEERLIKLISQRKGIGAILAEGVKRASQILGRGEELAVHVKGLEAPAWDPRGLRTYALSYATADIGASHLRGWPHPHSLPNDGPAKELVPSLIENRDKDALFDSLGVCKFLPYTLEDLKKFYKAITGERGAFLENLGAKIETIARIYNVLGSLNPPEDDTIPPRWWEKEEDGPAKGNAAFKDYEDFLEVRSYFYKLRGWHEKYGVPMTNTLEELGLREFLEDAHRAIVAVKQRGQ